MLISTPEDRAIRVLGRLKLHIHGARWEVPLSRKGSQSPLWIRRVWKAMYLTRVTRCRILVISRTSRWTRTRKRVAYEQVSWRSLASSRVIRTLLWVLIKGRFLFLINRRWGTWINRFSRARTNWYRVNGQVMSKVTLVRSRKMTSLLNTTTQITELTDFKSEL